MWIRAMGIKLKHSLTDEKNLTESNGSYPENISFKKENSGSYQKKKRQTYFRVNLEAMQEFTEVIKRRYKAGVSAWGALAEQAPSEAGVENLGALLEELGLLSPGVGDAVTLLHEYWFERDEECLAAVLAF